MLLTPVSAVAGDADPAAPVGAAGVQLPGLPAHRLRGAARTLDHRRLSAADAAGGPGRSGGL